MNNENPMDRLVEIMRKLRSPEGCPWDREQTHQSLKRCIMDECAELMDAIDDSDDAGMREELGDVLMNVVLQSVMAEERGAFTFEDVVREISEKMIRRHPHVFGDVAVKNATEVLSVWEKIKKEEKSDRTSILDGIAFHCPALLQATKIQQKVAKYGFDWKTQEEILDKIQEELDEVREAMKDGDPVHIEEEIGDLLFATVNLPRFRKDPPAEELLAAANRKFTRRFQYVERKITESGRTLKDSDIEEMERLWQEAKKELKS